MTVVDLCLPALSFALLAGSSAAQIGGNGSQGPFAPTANTNLDTSVNGGVFQFTRIAIPAGVTVTATGPNPAVLQSQGRVDIAGELVADAAGTSPGPGGCRGGNPGYNGIGSPGEGPGAGQGGLAPMSPAGQPAAHATSGAGGAPTYGAAFPFDVRGGSGGGGAAAATASYTPTAGGGGGGTIVVLADGAVSITGRVSVRGGDTTYSPYPPVVLPGGAGSGGAILIRSLTGVDVQGVIDAGGGVVVPIGGTAGGDGFVRIDAFAATPAVRGQVLPAPTALELPHLRELAPPRIGQVWSLRISSVPGDALGVFFALGGASVPTPFGTLVLDSQKGLVLGGQVSVPAAGIDPLAVFDLPVPNNPALRGFTIHVQAFNVFGAVRALRLSNGIVSTVQ